MYNINTVMFYGVVENRKDPLKLGRVAVRVHGIHTEVKANIPTDGLHWAMVAAPTTSASVSGKGSSSGLVEGSHVLGMFLDGSACQQPIIMFSVPGIPLEAARPSVGFNDPRTNISPSSAPGTPETVSYPSDGSMPSITEPGTRNSYPDPTMLDEPDTNRLARNENVASTKSTVNKAASRAAGQTGITTASHESAGGSDSSIASTTFDEPDNPYNAVYPYNGVFESESGHILEFDDTPGAERIHLYHRSGSFEEFHPSGTRVSKTVGKHYSHKQSDSFSHVEGTDTVVIDKGHSLKVNADGEAGGDLLVEVGDGGDMSLTVRSGNVNITVVSGDVNLKVADGNFNKYVNGNVNETITGNYTMTVNGALVETIDGTVTENTGSVTKTITGTVTTNADGIVNSATTITSDATGAHSITGTPLSLN